jgi:hypothetical protein
MKPSHGRIERRECWALSDPFWQQEAGRLGSVGEPWPGLRQLCAIRRQRTLHGQTKTEVVYEITSLGPQTHPARTLLALNRSYWTIENRLHWVRDVTLGEDQSQVRSGAAPQVMAALRNLQLTLLRRTGVPNIAAALRTYAARPTHALRLVLSAGVT